MATFQDFLEQRKQTPTIEPPTSDFQKFLQQRTLKTEPKEPAKPFIERKGIIQSILKAPIELGKDIAKLAPEAKEEKKSRQNFDFLIEKVKNADLDERQKQIVSNILDDIPPFTEVVKPKSVSQITGDVLGTALFLAPVGSVIKGGTFAAHLARGGLIGAGFGATESLSEGDDTKDFIKNTLIGAGIGAPLEVGGAVAIKGIGKGATLVGQKIKPFFQNLAEKNPRFLMSIGARLRNDFGEEGKEIAERFLTADRTALQRVGGKLDDLSEKGLFDLDDEAALRLTDALEGRAGKVTPEIAPRITPELRSAEVIQKELNENLDILIKQGKSLREISRSTPEGLVPKSGITKADKELVLRHEALRKEFLAAEKVAPKITPELEPLAQEARKFKSAKEFVDSKISSQSGRVRISEIENVFRLLPDGTTAEKDFVVKRGDKIFPVGDKGIEMAKNSDITINSDGSLKEGFGLTKASFLDDVNVESQLTDFFNKVRGEVSEVTPTAVSVVDDTIRPSFEAIDNLRNEIGKEAQKKGVQVRLRRGEVRPFFPRKDFFPHISPSESKLQAGKVREQVLDNSVRIGRFKNKEDATKALDSYLEFVEKNGKGGEFWVNWLVEQGQAESKDQARGMTLRFFKKSRLQRFGSLEKARELDFPFYDPDPRRVIPAYAMGSIGRLEEITQFGQKFEEVDKLIGAIRRKQGVDVGREVATLVKKARGAIETSPKREQVSLFLRTLQIPKLAFAQVLNVGQNVNTLLATDTLTMFKAIPLSFRDEGIRRALQTGSTLESVLREAHRVSGVETQFGEKFLRYIGFTASEKFNRVASSNAGIIYAQRTLEKLRRNPDKAIFRVRLREFGIEPEEALRRGITEQELLRAGQIMTELTQFRARPIDLPAFAASPEGKIAFQFKSFAFNQTKFIKNKLKQQIQAGNYKGVARDLLVLSTVFPMVGEVIADIRSLITGQKRPTNALERYFDSLMSVGAFGIFADAWQSAKWGSLSDFVLGPTAGTITEAVERVVNASSKGEVGKTDIKFLLRQTGFGRAVANYAFPNSRKDQETFLQTLIDGYDEF